MELYYNIESKLTQEKERILQDTIAMLGINIDWRLEQIRRFKSFTQEVQGNKTTIWYNDGSIEGLRIITFEVNISFPNCSLTYY